jgi:UDP-N-acetylmuramoyl-L-alanine---L-glutamate ligase
MRATDFGGCRVAIWGLGREGRAAIRFVRTHHPTLPLLLLDDAPDATPPNGIRNVECAFGAEGIAAALARIDVLIKSPGVSLYRREIAAARGNGVAITSLLNLWFAENTAIQTIAVTGTKGKSTTASLIAHILSRLGLRVTLAGNIGVPVTEIDQAKPDYAVIEVSSYQAADFDGECDSAVLTSLFPEHLDWHGSLEIYYRDKLNLLSHSRCAIVDRRSRPALGFAKYYFNDEGGLHSRACGIFDGGTPIGSVRNRYLARSHNRSNVCAALTVAKVLDLDLVAALRATEDFRALPHRQQELGEIDGRLYVDDSISTAPEATIAALDVYAEREITLIVGGYDRGLDYDKLVAKISGGAARAIICLSASGSRVFAALRAVAGSEPEIALVRSMEEAIAVAKRTTPPGGVVLLSPAAPSYGSYRDFAERGCDFASKAGFVAMSGEDPPWIHPV